jgi:hypothetical protein
MFKITLLYLGYVLLNLFATIYMMHINLHIYALACLIALAWVSNSYFKVLFNK